jgi:putative salt-induced outer membrane protein YdiY
VNRLALSAVLLLPAVLAAQAPPQPAGHEFSTNLAFVNTTGNTAVTTTGVDEKLILRPGWRWTHTQGLGVIYGKSAGTVNAESYRASWKTEMAFTPRAGSYAEFDFNRNRFSGIDAQYIYSLGLSAQVLFATNDQISVESGFARIAQANVNGTRDDFFSGRVAGLYHHAFRVAATFDQVVELLPNLKDGQDLRINSTSSLVAPISRHFGLKAGYSVRYDHEPQPGFKSTDAIFTTGLQVSF